MNSSQQDTLPTTQTTKEHPSLSNYLSVREAALIIGVCTRSVYDYIAAGRLTALRLGTKIVLDAEEVSHFERSVVNHRERGKTAQRSTLSRLSSEAPARKREHPSLAGYISAGEAARILDVHPRSVYGYISRGRLTAIRVGGVTALDAEEVSHFERQVSGRRRERHPLWRVPWASNRQYLTLIRTRVREGASERLEQRLEAIRAAKKHHLVGTVARLILRSQNDPMAIQILLVWRQIVMPAEEERQAAIAALCDDLADLLDWEHATWSENRILLHAEG
jgi:excisionase family DNA binding protein